MTIFKPQSNKELKDAVQSWVQSEPNALQKYGHISSWDVSNVTNMSYMFFNAKAFNQSLDTWKVGNATDMGYMFSGARAFNQPLNDWNVSNATNMSNMFSGARAFNQSLNDWNVSNATNMSNMFSGARAFNQPLNKWDVSNVTNMDSMFSNAQVFNQSLNDWDVGNVTNMYAMFSNAQVFNQPLNKWAVGYVNNMYAMFSNAEVFNQPLNDWDVANVTNMGYMFFKAKAFNQPLDKWNVSNATDMSHMFFGATSFDNANAPSPSPSSLLHTTPIEVDPTLKININLTAYDAIGLDHIPIKDVIADEQSIVIGMSKSYYVVSLEALNTSLESNIKYECFKADSMNPTNINKTVPFLDLNSIGIIGAGLIRADIMEQIMKGEIKTRLFQITPDRTVVSTVSKHVLGHNPNYVGASHCQEGQGMVIYNIKGCSAWDGPMPINSTPSAAAPSSSSSSITVQIKGIRHKLEITNNTSVNDIKMQLVPENSNIDIAKIRLIYNGKELKDGTALVSEISDYDKIMFIATMPQSGGRRRQTMRRQKKRRTIRVYKKRKTKRRTTAKIHKKGKYR